MPLNCSVSMLKAIFGFQLLISEASAVPKPDFPDSCSADSTSPSCRPLAQDSVLLQTKTTAGASKRVQTHKPVDPVASAKGPEGHANGDAHSMGRCDNDWNPEDAPDRDTPAEDGDDGACLCVFDIDRTLTGKQWAASRCPGAVHLEPPLRDNGYDGGDVTLAPLVASGIRTTFCNSCHLGITSAGQGSGDGSGWNNYILDNVMRGDVQDNFTAAHPDAKAWSWGWGWNWNRPLRPTTPYILEQPDTCKQFAVRKIWRYYRDRGVNLKKSEVYFFGDRTENIDPFSLQGFTMNSREISCGSRDWGHHGKIGECGARVEEIVKEHGNHKCR